MSHWDNRCTIPVTSDLIHIPAVSHTEYHLQRRRRDFNNRIIASPLSIIKALWMVAEPLHS